MEGRIMWFPPYDIQIGDTNSAQWNSVNIFRKTRTQYIHIIILKELVHLGFKMVVDHPSILNVIVQKRH